MLSTNKNVISRAQALDACFLLNVSAESHVGSVPAYSAIALCMSKVRVLAHGPFLIPSLSLFPTSLPD